METVKHIGAFIGSIFFAIGSFFTPSPPAQQPAPVAQVITLGSDATNPLAGTVYNLAGSGVSAGATSVTLVSLTIPQTGYKILDADLSATFYITFEPGSRTRQEITSCTTVVQNAPGTATLSGCSRGLLPFSPYTASSSYAFPHGGGTQVVFSNAPQLYKEFAAIGNAETITGDWRFPEPTNASNAATKNYADSLVFAGAPNGNFLTKGIFQEATTSDLQVSSSTGSTGAELVVGSRFVAPSSSPNKIPLADGRGLLDPSYLGTSGTSSNYTLAGNNVVNIKTATSTATSTDNFNLLPAGVVQMYATATAPNGWLLANGTEYATSTYPRLFAVIGYTYGGSTSTFKVPDFRGRQPVGAGQDSFSLTVATTSVTTSDDTFTITANSSTYTGTPVTLTIATGTLPAPLATGTTYYVIASSTTKIQFATSTNNAATNLQIDLTTVGSSTITVNYTYSNIALAQQGGQEQHLQVGSEVGPHSHAGDVNQTGAGGAGPYTQTAGMRDNGSAAQGITSNSVSTEMNTEDPYIGITFIIKY